jgi:hypothetical protein
MVRVPASSGVLCPSPSGELEVMGQGLFCTFFFCCFSHVAMDVFGMLQHMISNVAILFLGCCNKCFCDIAVLLFEMLQHIIFDVTSYNFRCCSTCFF